jgi:hypothetical protein
MAEVFRNSVEWGFAANLCVVVVASFLLSFSVFFFFFLFVFPPTGTSLALPRTPHPTPNRILTCYSV